MIGKDLHAIFLIGIQGCGKGTQRKEIANKLTFKTRKFVEIGSSDILDQKARRDPKYLHEMTVCRETGNLTPDSMVIDPIIEFMELHGLGHNLVLDGCLRSLPQTKVFPEWLESKGYKVTICLLRMPREESIIRIAGRKDKDGKKRVDDKKKRTVKKRHTEYYRQLPKILNQLVQDGHSINVINASMSVAEVFDEICRVVQIKPTETMTTPTNEEILNNPFKYRRLSASS